jgi:DNA-binding transcriptional regulator YiaG
MDAGLKIKELANMLGVAENTVINWEVRGVRPSSRNLEKLHTFCTNVRKTPHYLLMDPSGVQILTGK